MRLTAQRILDFGRKVELERLSLQAKLNERHENKLKTRDSIFTQLMLNNLGVELSKYMEKQENVEKREKEITVDQNLLTICEAKLERLLNKLERLLNKNPDFEVSFSRLLQLLVAANKSWSSSHCLPPQLELDIYKRFYIGILGYPVRESETDWNKMHDGVSDETANQLFWYRLVDNKQPYEISHTHFSNNLFVWLSVTGCVVAKKRGRFSLCRTNVLGSESNCLL